MDRNWEVKIILVTVKRRRRWYCNQVVVWAGWWSSHLCPRFCVRLYCGSNNGSNSINRNQAPQPNSQGCRCCSCRFWTPICAYRHMECGWNWRWRPYPYTVHLIQQRPSEPIESLGLMKIAVPHPMNARINRDVGCKRRTSKPVQQCTGLAM